MAASPPAPCRLRSDQHGPSQSPPREYQSRQCDSSPERLQESANRVSTYRKIGTALEAGSDGGQPDFPATQALTVISQCRAHQRSLLTGPAAPRLGSQHRVVHRVLGHGPAWGLVATGVTPGMSIGTVGGATRDERVGAPIFP